MKNPRFVKITHVDKYGFNGRDRHPDEAHIGKIGVVVKSYYEGLTPGLSVSADCEKEAHIVGQALYEGESALADLWEVCEVYIPDLKITVTVIDHEFEDVSEPEKFQKGE